MVVIKLSTAAHPPPPSASGPTSVGNTSVAFVVFGVTTLFEDTRPCTNLPSMCTGRLHVRGSQAARLVWPLRHARVVSHCLVLASWSPPGLATQGG
jgi:hypothetical protein